jgi:hypothetical protein
MTPNRRYCPTHLHITSTTGDCPVCGEQTNPFDADNGRSEVQAILNTRVAIVAKDLAEFSLDGKYEEYSDAWAAMADGVLSGTGLVIGNPDRDSHSSSGVWVDWDEGWVVDGWVSALWIDDEGNEHDDHVETEAVNRP